MKRFERCRRHLRNLKAALRTADLFLAERAFSRRPDWGVVLADASAADDRVEERSSRCSPPFNCL
jgi:hypothetical protein